MTILSEAAAVVAALGLLGGLAAVIAAIRFASRRSAPPRAYPPVTIFGRFAATSRCWRRPSNRVAHKTIRIFKS